MSDQQDGASRADGATPGWLSLALFGVATVAVVGALNVGAGIARPSTYRWYRSLQMPTYKPPDVAIPVAWSVMYTLAAVSVWRVWQTDDTPARRRALALWGTQLVANGLWTRFFFGYRRPGLAAVDAAALLAAVTAYAVAADAVDRPAALLVVPYVGWVGFAAVLTADIDRLNP